MPLKPHSNLQPIDERINVPRLFVTGTDTEIGKSVVACQILKHWQNENHATLGIKPIATGCPREDHRWINEDARNMAKASTVRGREYLLSLGEEPGVPLEGFLNPLGPVSAARFEERVLNLHNIDLRVRRIMEGCLENDIRLVIEGLGGVMVPLSTGYFVADWIAELAVPTVVVCRTELGTINHTMMTVEALTKRGVSIAAVVASRQREGDLTDTERSGISEIREQLPGIPVMILGYLRD